MAEITHWPLVRHLRAEPNQFILHYRNGSLIRQGAGLAYWFTPLSASVAEVPVEDCETTFVINERSIDFQEVVAQCTIRYRLVAPVVAASRVNFSINLQSGRWIESPLEKIASFWAQRAQSPARACLSSTPITESLRTGAQTVRAAIAKALAEDPEVQAMGLSVVSVEVTRIAPLPELDKALQTPTREAIQQKADEAVFARRALAVEKERAIKENELATQIELARREEDLIRRQGSNRLLSVQQEDSAERAKTASAVERQSLIAAGYADEVRTKAAGDAAAVRLIEEAKAEGEQKRMDVVRDVSPRVLLALAIREVAGKLKDVHHLNITPDMIGQGMQEFFRSEADK